MRLTAPILLLLPLAGCSPARPGPSPATAVPSTAAGLPAGEVVATVDGVAITASRVAELAEATGLPPRTAVDRLVEFELLAAEARRRGLERDPDARAAGRKAMVQRYLAEEFEATHRIEDMPEAMLRKAYEQNIRMFVRPRLRKVAHILVEAPAGRTSPADRALARRLGQKVRTDAAKVHDLDGFLALGRSLEGTLPLPVRTEDLQTYIAERAPLDPAFIEGALSLDRVGEVSPPVESSFGTHVIFLKAVEEPIDRSFEEVRDEVAGQEHPFWMKAELERLVDRLRLSTRVTGWSGELRRDADR